jgi:tRNA(His) 5'-end guanylyltransferase
MMDSLGDRMKMFESVPRTRLVPKVPVLLRLDGKAFHSLTRGLDKPVDQRFARCMWQTAIALCEELQGCQLGYVQSDEITILLVDYQGFKTQAWFDYEVQKMVSIAAGLASACFTLAFRAAFPEREEVPVFDCRAWNLPRHEVVNCFIWRQQDASRNSVSGLAQAHFSQAELHGKSSSEMQDMLMLQRGINWNDCPIPQKRGVCIVKESYEVDGATRGRWIVDEAIPIFTQDRLYVQRRVDVEASL